MKQFSFKYFVLLLLIFGVLTFASFFAAWAKDEGTAGSNILLTFLATLFEILRLPSHALPDDIIYSFPYFFGLGLVINCIFYSLLFERIRYYLKERRKKATNL